MDDQLKQILRKSGYKATNQRLAILSLFKKNKKPLSAQEIIFLLPYDVDQATIYRTLGSLKEKGIIRSVDLRHNHAHYEMVDIANHHHIICLTCGKIEDIEHQGVEKMEKTILHQSKYFFNINQHTLEFYGICKKCASKGK